MPTSSLFSFYFHPLNLIIFITFVIKRLLIPSGQQPMSSTHFLHLMNQSEQKNFMMQSTHASISKLLSIISNPVIRIVIQLIFSITSIRERGKSGKWKRYPCSNVLWLNVRVHRFNWGLKLPKRFLKFFWNVHADVIWKSFQTKKLLDILSSEP